MKTDMITWLINVEDGDQLARIWCALNGWRWPKEVPEKFKPQWWESSGVVTYRMSQDRKQGFIHLVNGYIEKKIPKEKIDEWWMKPHDNY